MPVLIVAPDYRTYREFMRFHFYHFGLLPNKHFEFVSPQSAAGAKGYQTGTLYINPVGVEMPEWFGIRFTEVEIKGKPGDGRWVGPLGPSVP